MLAPCLPREGARPVFADLWPMLMVEVEALREEGQAPLKGFGQRCFNPHGWVAVHGRADYPPVPPPNTFCFDPQRHAAAMARLGLDATTDG